MRNDTGFRVTDWLAERHFAYSHEGKELHAVIPATTPDLAYYYDGTWEGWLCCVGESYLAKEIPGVIVPQTEEDGFVEENLFYTRTIVTRTDLARRVCNGIVARIGADFLQILQRVFCSCIPDKEAQMLLFTHKGFRYGKQILYLRQDVAVKNVLKGLRDLGREVDKWWGFVRFSDVRGILVAVIGAKNHVLPFIAPHFCDRYHNETFMIFDRNHRMALLYRPGEKAIVPMEEFAIAEISEEEQRYRSLWKQYYDAIEIQPRHNETCRRTHMPKRYWDFLTEMTESEDCISAYKELK